MEKMELEKHLENNDFQSIFGKPEQVLENLLILKEVKFANYDPEILSNFLERLIILLQNDSHDIFVAVMHVVFQVKQTIEFIDYSIPKSTIPHVITKVCKEKYTQSFLQNVLKFVLDANNLASDGQSSCEIITPLLLKFINTHTSFDEDTVNYCAMEIIGNISAYGFPQSFLDAFESKETISKAALIVTYNVQSYSTEDKAKLFGIIMSKLQTKSNLTKYLVAAALLIIEDDQAFLFDCFLKLASEDKAYVLSRLSERQQFFATHDSILLHSVNSSEAEVLEEADKVMDHLGKNTYKQNIDNLGNWGEFYTLVLQMVKERREFYKKDLETYLSSMLFALPMYKDIPLSISIAANLLHKGFTSPEVEYNGVWELEMDDPEENTYEEVERILQEQIADLHRMREKGLLENVKEGVEAPSGREWNNFDIFSYLEKAVNGHEQSSLSQCRWDDISTILLMGRISE